MTKQKNIISIFISIISGLLLPLAFAPFDISIIAFISPTLLLTLWLYTTPKQAFLRGLFYGFGFFGFGIYWIYISIHTFGNVSLFIAGIITFLLISILALFPAIQGYCLSKFFPKNNLSKVLLAFPASWVLFEWFRIWILSGFPWLFLGYSQVRSPLNGLAPIFGVYGISFAVAFTCATFISLFITKKLNYLLLILITIMSLWIGSFLLTKIQWTKRQGQSIKISLIQGNISQKEKWNLKTLSNILFTYKNLTIQHWNSKLIVWPETAIPVFSWEVKPYLNKLEQQAKRHKVTIITGIPIENTQTGQYYNGMIAFGQDKSIYLKRHLVPLGEYPMFAPISTWFMKLFKIPMSNFTKGPANQHTFIADNLYIAPSICYEIAYPTEILTFLPKAELLINITDDSWFGKSIASNQQLQMAQMRSLETGRYQLVDTNTGLTAIIRPNGRIQTKAPPFKQFVLTGRIYAMTGTTPWIKFGNYLWLILDLILLVIAINFQRYRK